MRRVLFALIPLSVPILLLALVSPLFWTLVLVMFLEAIVIVALVGAVRLFYYRRRPW